MAEAIGIASGAIAFADFAGKAISLSIKLKLLWDEVKEVPTFLLEKVEELQDLGELLSHAETQAVNELAPASVWSTAAMQKAIGRARAAMGDLQQAVDVLYAQVVDKRRHKRRFAAARVVIQKKDLEMTEKKLDQALRRYQMAQNLYLVSCASIMVDRLSQPRTAGDTAMVKQNNSVGTELLKSLCLGKPAVAETTIPDAAIVASGSTVFGRVHMGFGEKGYRFSMRTPAWLGGAVYAIMAKRSIMGWQLNLSTYTVVRLHAKELLTAKEADDVIGLKKQLCEMNLTPLVHNQDGVNLLYVRHTLHAVAESQLTTRLRSFDFQHAVTNEAMEITKWLLASGVHPGSYEEVTVEHLIFQLSTPLDNLLFFYATKGHYGAEALKVFVDYMPEVIDEWSMAWTLIVAGTTYDQFLDVQKVLAPDYLSFDIEWRLFHAYFAAGLGRDWDMVVSLLPEARFLTPDSIVSFRTDILSITQVISLGLARDVGQSRGNILRIPSADGSSYMAVLREVARTAPSDLSHYNADDGPGRTSVLNIFFTQLLNRIPKSSLQMTDAILQAGILSWTTTLHNEGIDLLDYGRKEAELARDRDWRVQRGMVPAPIAQEPLLFSYNLVGITYGSLPEHWKVWWAPLFEEGFCDFWDLVEGQKGTIPGSWEDDFDEVEEIPALNLWRYPETWSSVIWSEYREIKPPV